MHMATAQDVPNDLASTDDVTPVPPFTPPSTLVPSDALLIIQISQGHEPALGTLYDRYSRLVYAVALRITNDQSSAEEVVQDVFCAVWRSAESFQTGANVKAWLNGITRHRAIDTTRVRNYRIQNDMVRLDEFHFLSAPTETETQVIDALECEEIWRLLSDLSPAQRTTFKLAYYAGFSPREIAAHTGVPLGTVKTRLRLGLSKLRSLVAHDPATA